MAPTERPVAADSFGGGCGRLKGLRSKLHRAGTGSRQSLFVHTNQCFRFREIPAFTIYHSILLGAGLAKLLLCCPRVPQVKREIGPVEIHFTD